MTEIIAKLHAFNIQKFAAEHHNDTKVILSDIHSFLDNAQSEDSLLPSRTYYMELVDENQDTDETMMLVAEDLLEKFGTQLCGGWVVLVGDRTLVVNPPST